ncbi:MAG TPA: diguanylate cyclase [Thermoanaerobaculia bacterium]|nr:diguanylate cyclase [Thermoanaerobaculia bacterium]
MKKRPILPPPQIQPDNYRMYMVVNYMCYLGIPAHLAFIPFFYWLGVPVMAFFNIFSTIAWVIAWETNRRGKHWPAINLLTIEVVLHSALATYCMGWDTGFQLYLMPMITVTMINNKMKKLTMLVQALGLVGLYAALYTYKTSLRQGVISTPLVTPVYYANVVIVFAALMIISYYFRQASLTAEKRMEELATTDALTTLANRRRMKQLFDSERARVKRSGRGFTLVLSDIDHFKRFNDTWGHDCGDYVLKEVAATLKRSLREQDTVGRWGGEEFISLLLETNIEQGMQAAEKMRKAIEEERFQFGGHDLSVTMTFGVATFEPGDDLETSIKRSDEALYVGKEGGRNRSVAWSPTEASLAPAVERA